MFVEVDILNQQTTVPVDIARLEKAAMTVLEQEQVASAVLSIAIVDNKAIHVINRDHLSHDYPTDVISFQLEFSRDADWPETDESCDELEDDELEDDELNEDEREEDLDAVTSDADEAELTSPHQRAAGCQIEGEVIASAEYAEQLAGEGGWTAMDELTLYVVHGILHICGYDDLTLPEKKIMRDREVAVMKALGLTPRYAANDLDDLSK